jgi:hypothetical protein
MESGSPLPVSTWNQPHPHSIPPRPEMLLNAKRHGVRQLSAVFPNSKRLTIFLLLRF